MRILIVTPAPRGSRSGNRVTAERWSRHLRALDHRVTVTRRFQGQSCDLLVALHARKSFSAIRRFHRDRRSRSLVVGLAGTDLYQDLERDRNTQDALEWATYLVALQPLAMRSLPRHLWGKTRVIPQSAVPSEAPVFPPAGEFRICVLGHLRVVKDPFRAAGAAAMLPVDSRVRVLHAGKALEAGMSRQARKEMAASHRYRWLGEVSPARARRILKGSHLLILSSRMEGGANIVSEAVVAGVPILASRIPGSLGLLGSRYPGFFPVGDTRRLAILIRRCEMEPTFYRRLKSWVRGLRREFQPVRERKAWESLLRELRDGPGVRENRREFPRK